MTTDYRAEAMAWVAEHGERIRHVGDWRLFAQGQIRAMRLFGGPCCPLGAACVPYPETVMLPNLETARRLRLSPAATRMLAEAAAGTRGADGPVRDALLEALRPTSDEGLGPR